MARKNGAARANAEMLSKLTKGGGRKRKFNDWLEATPKAKSFVDLWLDLRQRPFDDPDHSDWSASDVFNELRRNYGCPFTNRGTLHKWLDARNG
jgi:hypothetical protein